MNALAPLLRDDEIVLDADVHDRESLLRMGADLLAGRNALNGQRVFQALLDRERLGSTAMGDGVAIPHARIAGLASPACAYIRLRHPIPFGAHDGKPVSQFLLLLVPAEANEHHLQLMSAAAGVLSDPATKSRLRACERCEDARVLLEGEEARGDSPAAQNE